MSNAAKRYQHNLARTTKALATIKAELVTHEANQAKAPRDWGYTGDMSEIADKLEEIVAFMAGEE